MKKIDKKTEALIHLMKIGENYAHGRGFSSYAEDVAGYIAVKFLEGRKTSIKNLFIDFVREYIGDNRCSRESKRRDLQLCWQQSYNEKNLDSSRNVERDERRLILSRKLDKRLTNFQRQVFYLLLSGLSSSEIADMVGCSRSNISQTLRLIKRQSTILMKQEPNE